MTYYDKVFKTPNQLLSHLENKGLVINDKKFAKDTLSKINYYRFKIYLFPFYNSVTKKYHEGTTFQNGYDLYKFDNLLRNDVFYIISRVEIKIRSIYNWIFK